MLDLNFPPLPPSPCPANHFGRGKNFQTDPSNTALRVEILQLWEEWESKYPDDPDGTEYLEKYESKLLEMPVSQRIVVPTISVPETAPKSFNLRGARATGKRVSPSVRYVIPIELQENFRVACQIKKVAMSEVVRELITNWLKG